MKTRVEFLFICMMDMLDRDVGIKDVCLTKYVPTLAFRMD